MQPTNADFPIGRQYDNACLKSRKQIPKPVGYIHKRETAGTKETPKPPSDGIISLSIIKCIKLSTNLIWQGC